MENDNIKPGEWHDEDLEDIPICEDWDDTAEPEKKDNPEYFGDLILTYTAFRDQVYNPKSVLHPSCAWDASPSKVFDNVTYVDLEFLCEGAMEMFRRHGLKAFKQDINEYNPTEEHDLLILLNPAIRTEEAAQHLKKGGYILANDWHENATQMYNNPEKYEFLGGIDFVDPLKKDRVFVTRETGFESAYMHFFKKKY